MFGNQLTEEQRQNGLLMALGIGGVAGAAKYVDHLQAKNALYQTTDLLKGNKVVRKYKEIAKHPNSKPVKLSYLAELDTCDSCSKVIAEFAAKFKNIELEVIHNNGNRIIP
ncbi:hypothetical protein J7E95_11460 [Streptomyces sp. ISL-14]|uniref:deaminase domain-containing protein n=1 Tax=Bacillus sp. ISL-4 TaxID=2819125 RepID=UPI001C1BBFAC|nr:deaminase domain-containing protein [Bacillus sp. ISL-4]MBT2671433.1 hypothetical protein [Streptomyces sp. ISL-14]